MHVHALEDDHPRGIEAHRAVQRRLRWVLALTLAYTLAEVVGGIASNSLALLADAGHMVTDDLALGLAVLAGWFASRPPDAGRTYGYQRAEILAALANGVVLVAICGLIFWEAARRFASPPEVASGMMAAVGAGGLLVNLAAVFVLRGHSHGLNARAAQLHVIGDLLGSIGVLAAAAAIMWMGWAWADPVASIGIGIIVIVGSIRVVLQSVHVLMEGAPRHLNAEHVRTALCGLPGVDDVHDLHLWSLGGRAPLLTAHLVVDHATKAKDVLRTATALLADRFGIDHVTLQIEPADFNIRGIGAPPVDSGHGSP